MSPSPADVSFRRKLLYAAVTTLAFFALVELCLTLAGVETMAVIEDPFLGFTDQAPVFVPGENSQEFSTARNKSSHFNQQRFSRAKGDNTVRIFCLGGSTTYGRPYGDKTSFAGWLRAYLPAIDPGHEWEVVNAGGISYASYRVALVMEELTEYDPDWFIIYTGHNEFLERRTYGDILEDPALLIQTRGFLHQTRIYSLMARYASAIRSSMRQPPVTELGGEVTAILDVVGPSDYHRDDDWRKKVIAHFRLNLHRLVQIAESSGARVLFVTPASNLRDCSPFKSEQSDHLTTENGDRVDSWLEEARAALAEGDYPGSLVSLDRAIDLEDRYADAYFLRGQAYQGLEDHAVAKLDFRRALDEDICPLRAPTEILETLREVAELMEVPLVDFVSLAEKHSPHATPGREMFVDHVHPTIEGNRLLGLAIIDTLVEEGVLEYPSTWGEEDEDSIRKEVETSLDRRFHGRALRNLAKVMGWSGKLDVAGRLAVQATQLIPKDPESHLLAGKNYLRQGDVTSAIRHLETAIRLRPRYEPVRYTLGVAYMKNREPKKAQRHLQECIRINPNHVEARYVLADSLIRLGRQDEAREALVELLRRTPDHERARKKLAQIRR